MGQGKITSTGRGLGRERKAFLSGNVHGLSQKRGLEGGESIEGSKTPGEGGRGRSGRT